MTRDMRPDETELTGNWILPLGQLSGQLIADETCKRIDELVKSSLEKIAVSKECGAWETLYRDPKDGRYWEKTYPQSEMHGGGPPKLQVLSPEQAKAKYQF
ncbi:MAG TPA: Imm27 family immunity protein [Pseudolabrys sp.]|nr:Imm27 family immunity protein [Pseudolabrys sp.]